METGKCIESTLGVYRSAVANREAARAQFELERPAIPAELICIVTIRGRLESAARARSISITSLSTQRITGSGRYFRAKKLRAIIILWEVPRHTKVGKRMRRLVRVAKMYEQAWAEALSRSQYDLHVERAQKAAHAIEGVAREIVDYPARTMEGVTILARAAAAFEECRCDSPQGRCEGQGLFSGVLPKAIVRQLLSITATV